MPRKEWKCWWKGSRPKESIDDDNLIGGKLYTTDFLGGLLNICNAWRQTRPQTERSLHGETEREREMNFQGSKHDITLNLALMNEPKPWERASKQAGEGVQFWCLLISSLISLNLLTFFPLKREVFFCKRLQLHGMEFITVFHITLSSICNGAWLILFVCCF